MEENIKVEENFHDDMEEDYAIHDDKQEYKMSIMKRKRLEINVISDEDDVS